MDSKLDLDNTQCSNYLSNHPINLHLNTPKYNFACYDYGTPTTLPKYTPPAYIKMGEPEGISHKEDNIYE